MKQVAFTICAVVLLCGCTQTPKVAEPAKVSPWAKANVLGYDSTGIFVGPDWVRVYHGLLRSYGDKLPVNEQVPADDMTGIEKRGTRTHITFAVNKRFTDLKYHENAAITP